MKNNSIDRFRLIAAFLIVGIHTYPLSSLSADFNFALINIFARVAVPFFLMVTGYFSFSDLRFTDDISKDSNNRKTFLSIIKKPLLLYAIAILIYFPINIYTGFFTNKGIFSISFIADIFKRLIFDGTFYHLWYFPGLVMGVLLVFGFARIFSVRVVFILTVILYIGGLLGDSYYGVSEKIPMLKFFYDQVFRISSYTRNGFFYVPVFLVMGMIMAKMKPLNKWFSLIGFAFFISLMMIEGFNLHKLDYQRHDSMYILLLPVMFFLFQFVLSFKGKPSKFLRDVSLWIYILHPLVIILVRGVARITGLTGLLVENSIGHYLAVSLLSFVAAVIITIGWGRIKPKKFDRGRAWIELNRENLAHNVKQLRAALPEKCALMPAVKANAYGHGAAPMCRELNSLGVRAFCVATVMEGVELRKNFIKGEILVLGYTHPESFYLLKRYRLTQTVIDCEYAEVLDGYDSGLSSVKYGSKFIRIGGKFKVHVKIDTGLRRQGELSENIDRILQIYHCQNLNITGIYTHFSGQSSEFTKLQIERFNKVLTAIEKQGFKAVKVHAQGSYGIFHCSGPEYDYARPGLALYGAYAGNSRLRPVLSLKARISTIKMIMDGEAVGYGSDFIAFKKMKIAILPIGYADGIPRGLSNGAGRVLIKGKFAPIIGFINMDMMTVDVSDIEGVKTGDIAVMIGKDGDGEKEITVFELARQAGTIPNEILSRLGGRVVRGWS